MSAPSATRYTISTAFTCERYPSDGEMQRRFTMLEFLALPVPLSSNASDARPATPDFGKNDTRELELLDISDALDRAYCEGPPAIPSSNKPGSLKVSPKPKTRNADTNHTGKVSPATPTVDKLHSRKASSATPDHQYSSDSNAQHTPTGSQSSADSSILLTPPSAKTKYVPSHRGLPPIITGKALDVLLGKKPQTGAVVHDWQIPSGTPVSVILSSASDVHTACRAGSMCDWRCEAPVTDGEPEECELELEAESVYEERCGTPQTVIIHDDVEEDESEVRDEEIRIGGRFFEGGFYTGDQAPEDKDTRYLVITHRNDNAEIVNTIFVVPLVNLQLAA